MEREAVAWRTGARTTHGSARRCSTTSPQGVEIGRSTIYRTLETLAGEGMATKIVAPRGEVALYRLVNQGEEDAGQLVCVECGRVSTIDCDAFQEFSHHVSTVHGFAIDLSRTVLYGRCPLCAKKQAAAHA